MSKTARVLLWLFVINLGIAFGAGLYEHRIVVPDWITVSPDAGAHWNPGAVQHDDTGRRFWAFVTSGPLTLLTIANLAAAWRTTSRMRPYWLLASACAVADRVFTFAYFIPTMIRLMGMPDSPESAAMALQWSQLNYLRHAIVFGAWMAALKTLVGASR